MSKGRQKIQSLDSDLIKGAILSFLAFASLWMVLAYAMNPKLSPSHQTQEGKLDEAASKSNAADDRKIDDSFNENLKRADRLLKQKQSKIEEENRLLSPAISKSTAAHHVQKDLRVDSVNASQDILRDMQSIANPDDRLESLEDRLSHEISNHRENKEHSDAERILFVREFLENARDAGYEVLLNEDLQVVRVKAIPKVSRVPISEASILRVPQSNK